MVVPPAEIIGERIKLRPVRSGDLADIHAYASDPEVCRYVHWGPTKSIKVTERKLEELLARYEGGDDERVQYAIEHVEGGQFLGRCSLHSADGDSVRCGMVLNRAHWGQGYGTEVLSLLFIAAESYGFEKVRAACHPQNVGSEKVMQKVGMEYVGEIWLEKLEVSGKLYEASL